ncbi:MAG: hypothetical protein E3K38_14675 [Candidatus Kuenenia stuttgartiensis]|nr:hypothetical protein [Candidatus Kuenenia stuttgartiensis]
MTIENSNKLALTTDQKRILYTCQYILTMTDIQEEKVQNNLEKKKKWLYEWRMSIEQSLIESKDNNNLQNDCGIFINSNSKLEKKIYHLKNDPEMKLPLYLIAAGETWGRILNIKLGWMMYDSKRKQSETQHSLNAANG